MAIDEALGRICPRHNVALVAALRETDFFSSVMEEIQEDGHVRAIATLHEGGRFLNLGIHMDSISPATRMALKQA